MIDMAVTKHELPEKIASFWKVEAAINSANHYAHQSQMSYVVLSTHDVSPSYYCLRIDHYNQRVQNTQPVGDLLEIVKPSNHKL